jgi:hypothetical protein
LAKEASHKPGPPTVKRLRQEKHEYKASLDYIARSSKQTNKNGKTDEQIFHMKHTDHRQKRCSISRLRDLETKISHFTLIQLAKTKKCARIKSQREHTRRDRMATSHGWSTGNWCSHFRKQSGSICGEKGAFIHSRTRRNTIPSLSSGLCMTRDIYGNVQCKMLPVTKT